MAGESAIIGMISGKYRFERLRKNMQAPAVDAIDVIPQKRKGQ